MPDRLGDKIRLLHILEAIESIESYTEAVSLDQFVTNSMMFHATLRQLEIIGEASNRLSNELKQKHSDIPWTSIVGLRNLVIHEYFGIDDLTIWAIIKSDLPGLKPKISMVISIL